MWHFKVAPLLVALSVVGCSPVGTPGEKVSLASIPAPQISDEDLLGKYYQGDGLGANLNLTLERGHKFSYTWRGCLGVYDKAKGTWNREGDLVVLIPSGYKIPSNFKEVDTRFMPVRESNGQYLIEENSMPAFAAKVNRHELRTGPHGSDYVRIKSDNFDFMPVSGNPVRPTAYADYYANGPIETEVMRINPGGTVDLKPVPKNRLRPNMRLAIRSFDWLEVIVLSVTDTRVEAQPIYFEMSQKPISVGMKFTSGSEYCEVAPNSEKRLTKLPKNVKRSK